MKHLKFSIVVSIIFTSITFGQTINFTDLLEKSKCKSFECFNDFITPKGFSLSKIDESSYLYSSDERFSISSTNGISTVNVAIILFGKNGYTTTGIRTAVKSYYESLIKQIKSSGFISTKTENTDNGVIVYYEIKSMPNVSVSIETELVEKDGVKWTSYCILSTNRTE